MTSILSVRYKDHNGVIHEKPMREAGTGFSVDVPAGSTLLGLRTYVSWGLETVHLCDKAPRGVRPLTPRQRVDRWWSNRWYRARHNLAHDIWNIGEGVERFTTWLGNKVWS